MHFTKKKKLSIKHKKTWFVCTEWYLKIREKNMKVFFTETLTRDV